MAAGVLCALAAVVVAGLLTMLIILTSRAARRREAFEPALRIADLLGR